LKAITVRLPKALLDGIDDLIEMGMYENRSAVIRAAVRDLLKKELWKI